MLKRKRISALKTLLITAISAGMMFGIPAAYAAGTGVQTVETAETVVGTEQTVFKDAAVYAAYTGSVSLGVKALEGHEMPEIDRNKQSELEITVSTDGEAPEVAKIDVYINDEFKCSLTEQPYIIDISDCSSGIHDLELLAIDAMGNQVSKYTNKFVLMSTEKQLIHESDFTDGTGAMDISPINASGGYYDFSEIDSEHGKSLVISADTKTSDIGTYAHILTPSATGTYETELDVCVLEGDAAFHLSYRNSANSSRIGVIRFTSDGKISYLGTGGTLESNRIETYEKGKWYNIRMIFYAATRTYDLYINNELQITGRAGNGAAAAQGVSLLRFILENNGNSKGSIAIDNVKMYLVTKSLYITGAASDSNSNTVEPDAEKVYISLNNGISGDGLKNHISLSNHIGNIPINNITYDSTARVIIIEPGTKLQSSVDYVVKVAKGLPLTDGKMLSEDIYGRFTVDPDDLDIKEVFFKRTNGKVVATVGYENSFDDVITAKAVINVWKEGILKRASITDVALFPGGFSGQLGQYTLSEGERMEIHFIEAFDRHSLITKKTYEYVMR